MRSTVFLLFFVLDLQSAFGCMATEQHSMPKATDGILHRRSKDLIPEPRKCCAMTILDPASTAAASFTPALDTCPPTTQILCESNNAQATIILANGEQRVLATSDENETFSEIMIVCVEGAWGLEEDDHEETPPIARVLCNDLEQ
ncbi:hypothetical protein QR680_017796 [Steinernema hermaphroditum]|uniref:C6 domain-containing protein n=1 Tax=Steinernema hermaphroditum TaxID=289476 RepID=A0AA39HI90_9BILA|nr:hypothetical protein QR680_017796 [Steinernema hermaphroditum]